MQLTVLGGAAAWSNPGQGCSSYLITSGSTTIVVDCGSDTFLELRKHIDYHDVDAIVLSHSHPDHMLDLVPYRYGLRYGPNRTSRRIPVWVPPGGKDILSRIAYALASGEDVESFWSGAFDLHEYDPATTLVLGQLNISFAETQHYVICFAMRLDAPDGRSLFYSADTGSIEQLIHFASNCNVALIEATIERHSDGPAELRGHITPEEAGMLAHAARAERLLITHLWSERSDADVVSAARTRFGGPISVAKPGVVVDV